MLKLFAFLFSLCIVVGLMLLIGEVFPRLGGWYGFHHLILNILIMWGAIGAYYLATDTHRVSSILLVVPFVGAMISISLLISSPIFNFPRFNELSLYLGVFSAFFLFCISAVRFVSPIGYLAGGG